MLISPRCDPVELGVTPVVFIDGPNKGGEEPWAGGSLIIVQMPKTTFPTPEIMQRDYVPLRYEIKRMVTECEEVWLEAVYVGGY